MFTILKLNAAQEALLDPYAPAWDDAEAVQLDLQPTPVVMQPSEYIQSTVDQSDVGKIKQLDVRALYDEDTVYFRLRWEDASQDIDLADPSAFADSAAIMFPFNEDAPLMTMGSADQPVNQWHWRADSHRVFNVTTAGLGTTYRTPDSYVNGNAVWQQGVWTVVFSRSLQTSDPNNHVSFQPDQPIRAAFCIWEGASNERAGLKSFSPVWTDFRLEA